MNDKILSKIINIVKNLQEEGIPTNNVSGGKMYIYQKGLRKIWQPTNGREN